MKKLILIVSGICLSLALLIVPKAHAYTLTDVFHTYYNQTTDTIGEADVLDIGTNYIEYMYYNLGTAPNDLATTRLVFSNLIVTEPIPLLNNTYSVMKITISLYNSSNALIISDYNYYQTNRSLSYYENNFVVNNSINVDYIIIKIEDIPIGYDEVTMHQIMQGAIIGHGNSMIINQTVNTIQYNNGWSDAMNSKVTQIWSLWGNIFDTFMSVFDIFSIQLMGDITIGHIAMVPLVLGLIGFIYALGGKRGR